MKKLHILGGILILFAIWINTLPQDSSKLPEIISAVSAIGGLGLGIASLFVKKD